MDHKEAGTRQSDAERANEVFQNPGVGGRSPHGLDQKPAKREMCLAAQREACSGGCARG
jgi:hypothetical protein